MTNSEYLDEKDNSKINTARWIKFTIFAYVHIIHIHVGLTDLSTGEKIRGVTKKNWLFSFQKRLKTVAMASRLP